MNRRFTGLVLPLVLALHAPAAFAAGHWILGGPVAALTAIARMHEQHAPPETPRESSAPASPVREGAHDTTSALPLALVDHRVNVTVHDGFARTEVLQVWSNPNGQAREARYAVPLPKNASLSEMSIRAGEVVLNGEVRQKAEAERIYEEEKDKGNDAGLAKKDEYRTFEFAVARVLPRQNVQVRYVYYQPLAVDTGVARYVYPMEAASGTEAGASFWKPNVAGEVPVKVSARVRVAWPVEDLRFAGIDQGVAITRKGEGELTAEATAPAGRDVVMYYRLRADLPGRVEVIPYRGANGTGTFMAVLTPGVDLPKLPSGADHIFVLDVSGSMDGQKIETLKTGVTQALKMLVPPDRFTVITFNTETQDITGVLQSATAENVSRAVDAVNGLRAGGGTDLFRALQAGLNASDTHRTTNLVLVTDGVANTGMLDSAEYRRLLSRADVRLHAFLVGDSANWPLMETIANASGGHYQAVSNADDIMGLIALTRDKVTCQAIHDVKVAIDGGGVEQMTAVPPRIYHGQQLVLFGRYTKPGKAHLEMTATVAGEPHTYAVDFNFPESAPQYPELVRLWAMARCEELKQLSDAGLMDGGEAKTSIAKIGVEGQVVNDETAMVMLTDGQFAARGMERTNRDRTAEEARATELSRVQPARSYRVDTGQTFSAPAPNVAAPRQTYTPPYTPPASHHWSGGGGHGGGALDPLSGLMVLALAGLSLGRKEDNE